MIRVVPPKTFFSPADYRVFRAAIDEIRQKCNSSAIALPESWAAIG
jgi:hypothetical protein